MPEADITRILQGLGSDPARADELLPLVYDELRALARARIAKERPGQTLDATALVHEAWLRVAGGADDIEWNGRGHFFGAAAQAMRRILVEQARAKARIKRGGGRAREEADLDGIAIGPGGAAPPSVAAADVLAVEEALERLEAEDPRKGRIVELRYFAGLTVPETAAAMDLSVGTIEREWRFIRAWLQVQLGD